jgi:OOP family OmpA-OmpF porin
MKYKQLFQITLALLFLLVAAVAMSPALAAVPGYVYSTDDKTPVRDTDGHCVRTVNGKEYAITDCNSDLPPAPKAVAAAPEPKPASASAAPADSDKDGVPDSVDKCPNTPAGVKVDANGCPIDSDGDGVPDYLDKCPDTPKGVKVDKDGCPLVAKAVEKTPEKVSIALEIQFDSGKAFVKPAYDEQIKKVADFMKTYPETTALIEGHTDNVGKEEYNLRLSRMRAESVKTYLVQKFSIPADRLSAKGFGSSQPIADNATLEGRQKNRRINAVLETTTR